MPLKIPDKRDKFSTLLSFWTAEIREELPLSPQKILDIIDYSAYNTVIETREVSPRLIREGPQYYASLHERYDKNSADFEIGSALFLCPRGLKV